MKKQLLALALSGLLVNQAHAGLTEEINAQIQANQTQVEGAIGDVSDNLLAVFAHRGLAPADTLGGGLFGVEIGVDLSMIDFDSGKLADIAGNDSDFELDQVALPKISAGIGLPIIPLDFAVTYLPEVEGFSYLGAHAKYAIIEGGTIMPAVAITGTYSQASMDGALDVTTMGGEVSVSKGFGVGIKLIPYAGIGYVTGTTKLNDEAIPDGIDFKTEYESSASRMFVGASLQIALLNFVAEMDQVGDYQSTSVKVGFRF